MEARAVGKYIPGSPQKARLVIDLIRGKSVNEARSILLFSPKRAARKILGVLQSAIANALRKADEQNIALDVDDLVISECYVNSGPTKHRAGSRRYRPAPRGRAYLERRRSSHITIVVATRQSEGGGE
jgi:large subunit ribosomal protein L22